MKRLFTCLLCLLVLGAGLPAWAIRPVEQEQPPQEQQAARERQEAKAAPQAKAPAGPRERQGRAIRVERGPDGRATLTDR